MEKAELNKLRDKVNELEITFEKIERIADNIDQGFFDLKDKDYILYAFDGFSVENDILTDYIHEMDEKLGGIKRMLGMVE
jgi:hypothetical protein